MLLFLEIQMGHPELFSSYFWDVTWVHQFEKVLFALVKTKEFELFLDLFDEFFLKIREKINEFLDSLINKILHFLSFDNFVPEAVHDARSLNNEASFVLRMA